MDFKNLAKRLAQRREPPPDPVERYWNDTSKEECPECGTTMIPRRHAPATKEYECPGCGHIEKEDKNREPGPDDSRDEAKEWGGMDVPS
jgi:ribosomal protein S27AE